MNTKKIRLGLVGKELSKSPSDKIHTFILHALGVACEYEKFSVSLAEFDDIVRVLLGDFDGFNITIPYKRDILSHLDEIQGEAQIVGAVNTVVCPPRCGYNTDGFGFMQMLKTSGVAVADKKVLLLGAGGAGRSCAVALKNAGARVFAYRRNAEELAEFCEQLGVDSVADPETGGFDIIVNATGVGMHDTVGKSPISKRAFVGAETAVDLIYEPQESAFLRHAKDSGVRTRVNGMAMLFYQAYYADCLFLDRRVDEREAEELYLKYLETEKI